MVEIKNGQTFNGILKSCDTWMNLHLTDDGTQFWKTTETFVKGNSVKYLRFPEEAMLDKRANSTPASREAQKRARGGSNGKGQSGGKFQSKSTRGRRQTLITSWRVNGAIDPLCGICRWELERACSACTVPGACQLAWGQCGHVFHQHCMGIWVEKQEQAESSQCPLCRQPWVNKQVY